MTTADKPKGFPDKTPAELAAEQHLIDQITDKFKQGGYEQIETPIVEYAHAIEGGLPEGMFQWQPDNTREPVALRYDTQLRLIVG